MLKIHGLTIKTTHLDTTSKSVQGKYSDENDEGFNITHGHSKDYRPDLKQYKIGAAVQQNGLPVMGDLLSGNRSDSEWNPKAICSMNNFFEKNEYENVIFVGDSATVSSYESLKKLIGIAFISRFPETFNLVDALKKEAFKKDEFEHIGSISKTIKSAEYKTAGFTREIDEKLYRFIVVHSNVLEAKRRLLQKEIYLNKKSNLKKKLKVYIKNLLLAKLMLWLS